MSLTWLRRLLDRLLAAPSLALLSAETESVSDMSQMRRPLTVHMYQNKSHLCPKPLI